MFIPVWVSRFIIGVLVGGFWTLVVLRGWPKPEEAKGTVRWLYMWALLSLFTRTTFFFLFDMVGLFPFPE